MLLSKDQILAADDIAYEDVEIPEWGGAVRVKAMSGTERDQYEASIMTSDRKSVNLENIRAKFVALVCVDADGKRLFSEADVAALGRKAIKPIQRLFEVGRRLSALSDADLAELSKNSNGGQAAASTSS